MPNIKLDTTTRRKLGLRLQEYILAGQDQLGGLPTSVWQEVERFYRNEQPPDPGAGLIPIHEPFSQPRQDALTAQCGVVLGRQEPYMLAECVSDPDAEDALQRLVHRLWQQAGFELQIRKASIIATNTNKAIFRVSPKANSAVSGGQGSDSASQRPGIEIAVIHPRDFVLFPATTGGIPGGVLSGHRFYRRIKSIKDLMEGGRYYNTVITGGDDPEMHDDTGAYEYARTSLGSSDSDLDNSTVELWECVVRLELNKAEGERMYRALVAIGNGELLQLEEYPYTRPWYFESFYIADESSFWSGKSVGRNLFTLQDYYNKLTSLIFTAGAKASAPVIFGPKLTEKFTKWKASDYVETDEPVQPWSPNVRFDVGPLVQEKMNCERVGDMVARVSQNTLGANNLSADTATENSIIASGVAVGIEEYIANFSSSFPSMAELTIEIAKGMYGDLMLAFQRKAPDPIDPGQTVTVDDLPKPEWLDLPAVWEVAGKSPSTTPQAKIQSAMAALQLIQIPGTGIDPYELAKVVLKNSALSGTDGIQKSKDQVLSEQAAQQQPSYASNGPLPTQMAPAAGIPGAGAPATVPPISAFGSNPAPQPGQPPM